MPRPVIDRLAARGAEPLHVPILQPAEPFLDLAGEELRRRVFLAEDERGRVRCLRPELTIPAARAHIERGRPGPVRYALAGTVFRQRGADGDEFPQAGIEAIGGEAAGGDARALADAVALVDELAPGRRAAVTVGDRALHAAVLGAIGVAPALLARLTRLHGDAAGMRAALDPAPSARGAPEDALGADPALPAPVRAALKAGDRAALERAIADAIAAARMGKGARRPAEIAARLMERHAARGASVPSEGLSDAQRGSVDAWLSLECPLDRVAAELDTLSIATASDDGALGAALAHHAARLDALRDAALDPASLTFRAALGRSLDYYTGLVFEITARDGAVLAAGGRYDDLLRLLKAPDPEPAVGFALWLDRLGITLDGTPRETVR